ncbi:3-oxoacyl-[acyl-carrier-protein] synthase III C-terminal domain-containing protein [Mesorhizobium sp. ORM6]
MHRRVPGRTWADTASRAALRLHQANARMNAMILKLSFGHEVGHDRAPMVLERLGNTAGAGAIVALSENHADMKPGDFGLICAFGAGYSIGGALLRML